MSLEDQLLTIDPGFSTSLQNRTKPAETRNVSVTLPTRNIQLPSTTVKLPCEWVVGVTSFRSCDVFYSIMFLLFIFGFTAMAQTDIIFPSVSTSLQTMSIGNIGVHFFDITFGKRIRFIGVF